jgi:hypothetical protein
VFILLTRQAVVIAGVTGGLGSEILNCLQSLNSIEVLNFTLGRNRKKYGFEVYDNLHKFIERLKEVSVSREVILIDCTTVSNAQLIEALVDANTIIPTIILGTAQGKSPKTEAIIDKNRYNKRLRIIRSVNSASELIDLLSGIKAMLKSGSFKGSTVCISESHQSTKKTAPGYANKLKQIFEEAGAKVLDIVSIREPIFQLGKGIKEEYLASHAAHWITISADGLEIRLEVKVSGKRAYAQGIKKILNYISMEPFFGIRDWEDIS